MRKFGAPETCIRAYTHWSVLLRPAQATLGALVLAAHEPAQALSGLSSSSFTELHQVTGAIESALGRAFNHDKINYLLLMMVDPDVHFHVIPRYSAERSFAGTRFRDNGWPGVPDLAFRNDTSEAVFKAVMEQLKTCWD